MIAVVMLVVALVQAPEPATYGVVCFDPAKGDLQGTRVVLSEEAGKPSVLFQHCTPGCSRHRTVSASRAGERLEFEIASLANEAQTARFVGRVRGGALTLEGLTPGYGFKGARLRKDQRCPKDTVLADP